MKAGKFQTLLERVTGSDLASIRVGARGARENDLLTTGARGVNAPDQTYLDAARMMIMLLWKEAPGPMGYKAVRKYGPLRWANPDFAWAEEPFTLARFFPDRDLSTFEMAFAALIEIFTEHRESVIFRGASKEMRDGTIELPDCRVELAASENAAAIIMQGAYYSFHRLGPIRNSDPDDTEKSRYGIQRISFINSEVLAAFAKGFSQFESVS